MRLICGGNHEHRISLADSDTITIIFWHNLNRGVLE